LLQVKFSNLLWTKSHPFHLLPFFWPLLECMRILRIDFDKKISIFT
jgi:hypothetical protein